MSGVQINANNVTNVQYIQLTDVAAPANPADGQGRLYKKAGTDGIFWKPDSAGIEVNLLPLAGNVTTTSTQTLSNKSLVDNSTFIINNADATKRVQFDVSGVTTATTRTLTLPNTNDTIVGTTATQSLSNKTLTSPVITGNITFDKATNDLVLAVADQGTNTATITIPDVGGTSQNIALVNHPQTLTNKTFAAGSGTTIDAALITAGTIPVARGGTGATTLTTGNILQGNGTGAITSTLAAPAGAIVGTTDTQTLTNKTFAAGSGTTIDAALITAGTIPVARGGTGATTHAVGNILQGNGTSAVTSTLAAPAGAIVGTTDTQTLTNKTFAAGSGTTIDASLITTGTLPVARGGTGATTHTVGNILRGNGTSAITSTLAAPSGAIVGTTDTQTLTNKTLVDATTSIVDEADNTKVLQFQCSGITTATTRMLTVPNASDTIAVLAAAQTFTNKTFAAGSGTTIDASLITTGTLPVARGGTGAVTHTAGNILQGNGTSAVTSTLAAPAGAIVGTTDTQTLTNKTFAAGSGTTIDAALITAGTLPVARGGTGATTHTTGNILRGNGTGAITSTLAAPTGAIVGTTDTQTLTNKTLVDALTNIVDDVDNTKVLQFQCSNITTATTRTLTIPNASDTIAVLATAQTLTNKSLVDASTNIIDDADNTKVLRFQCSGITTGTTRTLTIPNASDVIAVLDLAQTFTNKTFAAGSGTTIDAALITSGTLPVARGGTGATTFTSGNILRGNGTGAITSTLAAPSGALVGTTDTQTLTNKSLVDASTGIVDDADNTKVLRFQCSGITTATTRTLTVPNASDTIAVLAAAQTLTNKTLVDASTSIVDDADNTKVLQFQCSGITTGTTRTLTVPNTSDTIAVLGLAQSFTNKTITDSTNNVTANALRSATTTVNVSSATAPTAGQLLIATSSTAATWQTLNLSNGNGGIVAYDTLTSTSTLNSISASFTYPASLQTSFDTSADTANTYYKIEIRIYISHTGTLAAQEFRHLLDSADIYTTRDYQDGTEADPHTSWFITSISPGSHTLEFGHRIYSMSGGATASLDYVWINIVRIGLV